ncbi:DUF4389 domain-containing protein [Nitrosomonas sp.]|uniref:DUF4389 domain-containing protein n=1 Tax=Nitrosomonas sp. TaxID=42353 RepID=UPI0025CDE107|nr:DUF4389 domain-containing protein [Nitrosomonas sp.]MCC6916281.1 DUF4389 domain-containing protein [Nitrosomonas sp.]
MNDEVKRRLQSTEIWTRALFMLLFVFVQSGVKFMVMLLAVFQFISTILTGQANTLLLKLGSQLATYDYQINLFLTFNTEQRPFPFSSWPGADNRFPDAKPADTGSRKPEDNQGNISWFQ